MKHTVVIFSASTLTSVSTITKLGIPTSKLISKTSLEIDNKLMATYSLVLGLLVIFISWKFYNDWASGLAGFIYGGILFWSIKLFVELIKTLFG